MRAQRLANYYPEWTKLRADPSSVGARFFNVFSEYLEKKDEETTRIRDDYWLDKKALGFGSLGYLDLDDADLITFQYNADGTRTAAYPTTVTGDGATLTRVAALEEMFGSAPTRLTALPDEVADSNPIWDSAIPDTYWDITRSERLMILVSDSTEFKKVRQTRNRFASGRYRIVITGYDQNRNAIVDHVDVPDDGVLYTNKCFSAVTDVAYEGFDGRVRLYSVHLATAKTPYCIVPGCSLTTIDRDGPMCIQVVGRTIYGTPSAVLQFWQPHYLRGTDYRDGVVDEDTATLVAEQILLSGGLSYAPADFTIDPESNHLAVIDSLGVVHYYELALTDFTAYTEQPSNSCWMSLVALNSYPTYGATEPVITWFRQKGARILGVKIKRRSPTGTVHYLQANKTWALGTYTFPGTASENVVDSWNDFQFDTEYTEIGKWEYVIIVDSDSGTSQNVMAVMVSAVEDIAAIATSISAATAIFYGYDGNLNVKDDVTLKRFKVWRDYYYAETDQQRLYFHDGYSTVVVTP